MKKQIFTLAMCLALTTTSALANGTKTVSKTVPVKVVATKKAPAAVAVKAPEVVLTPEQLAKKKFDEKISADREALYCELKLTPEQRAKLAELDVKVKTESEPLIKKVHQEKMKLRDLKVKKAPESEILKQKHELKKARKAAKVHFDAARKEFDAILTPEQQAAFKAIKEAKRAARKAEMKKHENCKCPCHKHHGPRGPEVGSEVGPQGPCPVPTTGPAPKCPCEK